MPRTVRFKGVFQILDEAGKQPEVNKQFEKTKTGTELASLLLTIPANTIDFEVDISSIAQSIATYISPDSEVSVKYETNTNIAHKIDGPTVEWGTITKIFVSTGAVVPVNLQIILFGP